ncbi:uncharacterized protein LOC128908110 [Rissa tridactyla]|uniref:uncharacterized protein LOC128908110 n=1 Tax=Rissa tridactyla TaxID=75485 RepID=UPI0023BACC1F|nr:uncharacterized protein LOC128908110 [Rissa tridactyla]
MRGGMPVLRAAARRYRHCRTTVPPRSLLPPPLWPKRGTAAPAPHGRLPGAIPGGGAGPEPAGRRARPFGQRGAGPPARAQQSGGGGGSGSPSAAREENPARLIPLAAQNVNCQHFTTVALLLCPDSAGEMERIRSALQVRAIKVKEETWTKQDKAASLLHVFRSLPRSISSLNVNCQHFTTVALLLCPDSAGEMERIRSASRVRGASS